MIKIFLILFVLFFVTSFKTSYADNFEPNIILELENNSSAIWYKDFVTTERVPLVLFSHGFSGCNIQSSFLMQAFSDQGYFVAAPNHNDAHCNFYTRRPKSKIKFTQVSSWTESTYRDRAEDIRALVSALKANNKYKNKIDFEKIILVGHSLGGYTMLGLAGAWPSWKMQNVIAVLALSPYSQPFIYHKSLDNITIPIMYQGGTLDFGVTHSIKKNNGAFELSNSPCYFIEFKGAGHFAWTKINSKFHADISKLSVSFITSVLDPIKKIDLLNLGESSSYVMKVR